MLSYGVISLLALATASSASPISPLRRGSTLMPTPPPACLAKVSVVANATAASNFTSGTDTNLTDTSSLSNVTDSTNTTTTCLVSPSDLPGLMAGMNGTDLSNATSAYNCSSLTNSTSLPDSTDSDPSSSNTTDTSGLTPPDDSPSTDPTSSLPDDSTTTDSSALPTDTSSPAPAPAPPSPPPPPPPSTPPPPPASSSDDGGSSGVVDPASGQFTADTNDPEGRRKRSSVEAFISSWLPVRRRTSQRHPRIAQTDLPDVAQQWQDLCLVSGGDTYADDPCVQLAGIGGINALLSTGGVCDQQDNADKMVDFAKSPGVTNQDALIAAAIAYRKHARNADNLDGVVPATPYCTVPPRNEELVGVVNEQLPGVNPGIYGGPNTPLVAFGADGTCPAGLTPDVSTCSCA